MILGSKIGCNLVNLLFGDAHGLIYIQTVQINVFLGVIVLVDMVEYSPSNIPFDSDTHLLVLLVRYLFLRPSLLGLLVLLLCLGKPIITLHIEFNHKPFVLFLRVSFFGSARDFRRRIINSARRPKI